MGEKHISDLIKVEQGKPVAVDASLLTEQAVALLGRKWPEQFKGKTLEAEEKELRLLLAEIDSIIAKYDDTLKATDEKIRINEKKHPILSKIWLSDDLIKGAALELTMMQALAWKSAVQSRLLQVVAARREKTQAK